jgi:DNA processing protein
MPWVVARQLAAGTPPADLLRPHSPPPREVAARLEALEFQFVDPDDREWPFTDSPPDPPCAWLFAAGRPLPPPTQAGRKAVAVVGGRRASPLRRHAARQLAGTLAAAGCVVVSGGAAGVDTAAHRGALAAGGHTVAVLGCGLDVAYPKGNAELLTGLRRGEGTLLSEFPPGTPPRPGHFIPRNRLIAALAAAVVVVEAREQSGSLSTARAAAGRGHGRVLAVPGAPWDEGSRGCNDLIRDGATLVRGAADVLEELGLPAGPVPAASPTPPTPLTPRAKEILEALADGDVATPSRLARATGSDPTDLAAALLELELAGLITRTPGGVQLIRVPPS